MTFSDSRVNSGFTLIEVMIVVVIVGILSAIAYPAYTEYVRKSNRSEAKVALTEGAQALERYYSINGRYVTTVGGTTLPSVFPAAVPASGTAYYTVAGSGTANTFTLTATRAGTMAADDCGNYAISETGALTSTVSLDKCL